MFRACVISIIMAFVIGCSSIDKEFVRAIDSGTSVIIPRYIEYTKNDQTLDDETKQIRIKTAEDLRDLIKKAKNKVGD